MSYITMTSPTIALFDESHYDDPLLLTQDCKTENKNLIKWQVRIHRNSFPNQLEHFETIVGRGKYQRSK